MPTAEGKRGQDTKHGFLSPLDSPDLPLSRRIEDARLNGVRELGSVRRADFWTLYCPEFPLRKAPRITVRGHSVQNDSVPLRKAPLQSRIVPWSTRRPCGPLAFRRATEGSRAQRRVWGSQEGAREPLYRRKVCRHPTVKQKGRLPSGGLIPSCSPHGALRAPPGSLRAAPNAAATGSASHSPPQCSSLPPRPLPSRHPIQMVIPAYFFLRFSLFFSAALRAAPLLCPAAPAFFLRQR